MLIEDVSTASVNQVKAVAGKLDLDRNFLHRLEMMMGSGYEQPTLAQVVRVLLDVGLRAGIANRQVDQIAGESPVGSTRLVVHTGVGSAQGRQAELAFGGRRFGRHS
jgi:hypothetical protein